MPPAVSAPNVDVVVDDAKILIVDDSPTNIEVMRRILEADGYSHTSAVHGSRNLVTDIERAQPDLVVLDMVMPEVDGMASLSLIRKTYSSLPVLVVTSSTDPDMKYGAFARGATDYMTRPYDIREFVARVANLVRNRRLVERVRIESRRLGREAENLLSVLDGLHIEMLARMARIIEYRNNDLGEHTWRVARLAGDIGNAMGFSRDYVSNLRRAARLHDLGKVVVSDEILLGETPMTQEEVRIIKAHPVVGAHILSGGHSELVSLAESIALTHHERWDGRGYPQGLAAEEIPIEGRIVAVADAYDAMTNDRPYRGAMSEEAALTEIEGLAGKQFDPGVVAALLKVRGRTARDVD